MRASLQSRRPRSKRCVWQPFRSKPPPWPKALGPDKANTVAARAILVGGYATEGQRSAGICPSRMRVPGSHGAFGNTPGWQNLPFHSDRGCAPSICSALRLPSRTPRPIPIVVPTATPIEVTPNTVAPRTAPKPTPIPIPNAISLRLLAALDFGWRFRTWLDLPRGEESQVRHRDNHSDG